MCVHSRNQSLRPRSICASPSVSPAEVLANRHSSVLGRIQYAVQAGCALAKSGFPVSKTTGQQAYMYSQKIRVDRAFIADVVGGRRRAAPIALCAIFCATTVLVYSIRTLPRAVRDNAVGVLVGSRFRVSRCARMTTETSDRVPTWVNRDGFARRTNCVSRRLSHSVLVSLVITRRAHREYFLQATGHWGPITNPVFLHSICTALHLDDLLRLPGSPLHYLSSPSSSLTASASPFGPLSSRDICVEALRIRTVPPESGFQEVFERHKYPVAPTAISISHPTLMVEPNLDQTKPTLEHAPYPYPHNCKCGATDWSPASSLVASPCIMVGTQSQQSGLVGAWAHAFFQYAVEARLAPFFFRILANSAFRVL
ncbi:hypothetical protein A0H81_14024 [Grifola frondosa]|uniref:Uncharacterized protein n=1 Tax=Grifola frondosa TaxID=5627 RepID=A0A1C7LMJ3_GRIFR|nr:hypothetical protein A0H81_14024 [Grifola frondosa]